MSRRNLKAIPAWFLVLIPTSARADKLLYAYEGDVLPQQAGWIIDFHGHCEFMGRSWCDETIDNGHFVVTWEELGGGALLHYIYIIATIHQPQQYPPSLWVEARFGSNRPASASFPSYDGKLTPVYRASGPIWLFGDGLSEGFAYTGLPLGELYTVRYENAGGPLGQAWVNGKLFGIWYQPSPHQGAAAIQFWGYGGDNTLPPQVTINRWDFIRCGTIGYGERIVAAEPPAGFLDAGNPNHAALDRFTVTYDSPNYAYINDITVAVSCSHGPPCPAAPQVIATQRLNNGPPEVLEIVLDRPLPPHERTTFTFTDVDPSDPVNPTINTVAYTFQLGDSNADGQWNLYDFAAFQNCYGEEVVASTCAAFDFDASHAVTSSDYVAFHFRMNG